MRRPAAVAAAALLVATSCRTAGPSAGPAAVPADSGRTVGALVTVLAARDVAWSPRRFKALFRGEVSARAGLTVRGYLALFWDGESLAWRASVPLAGTPRSGVIRRAGSEVSELFPGRLAGADLLAVLFGVPEEPPSGEGAFVRGGRIGLKLPSGGGRAVLVPPSGGVTGLLLPGGVSVELSPGDGLPRRIELTGPEGRALLTLESYGDWPAGEEVPKG